MLQGVLARGTAQSLRALSPYVAGKTGTSDDENDAWFVGFTNDVTIAVWVGYDNSDGKRRTLGRGETGAKVAIPICRDILNAAWTFHAPKAPLRGPSPEAARQLVTLPINLDTGDQVPAGQNGAFTEFFRRDRYGQLNDTQFRLVPQADAYAFRHPGPWGDGEDAGAAGTVDDPYGGELSAQEPGWFEQPRANALPQQPPDATVPWWEEDRPRRLRRIDPDYFWGNGRVY